MKGFSGRNFEKKVLGINLGFSEEVPYLNFEDSIEQVVFKQPNFWDPFSPSTKFGRQFLIAVNNALYFEIEGYCSEWLRQAIFYSTGLYNALGTAADCYHHTDALVYCDLGWYKAFVTVDLTINDLKIEEEYPKPNHVLLTYEHFTDFTESGVSRLDIIAGVVAEQLTEQLLNLGVLKRPSIAQAS